MKKLYQEFIKGESPGIIWWIFPIIAVLILLLPWALTNPNYYSGISLMDTGQIGDTIGGITGPFIALLAALLTFFAFWVQYRSNIAQTKQFKKQDKDTKIDRFENKFFELLRLHRNNVSEISISYSGKEVVSGRKAFVSMFHEFKFCYYQLLRTNEANKDNPEHTYLNTSEIVNLSYLVFFMGVGNNSDILTQSLVPQRDKFILNKYIGSLKSSRINWKKWVLYKAKYNALLANGSNPENTLTKINPINCLISPDGNYLLTIKYLPFGGHMSRLGHYYRHLFQTVKYVDEQRDKIIKNKYDYIKTIRAQLSNHEQLLLFYNSQSSLGKNWIEKRYLKDYKLLKNIPLPLANLGVTPIDILGKTDEKGEKMFEWDIEE